MWTPRRIVLLAVSFVVFFLVYLGYAFTAIGRIDGLPPLPEAYYPDPDHLDGIAEAPKTRSNLDARLQEAFGPDCKEQKWAIRLEIHSRNMLLAAEQFSIQDGKVILTPLSVALFGKKKSNKLPAEINTIQSDVAILTFDRPVTSFSEISSRKIADAKLNGKIKVISNRGRPQHDQDLKVLIDNGPLFYKESTHRIWTEALVKLEDNKTSPPNIIRGQGMEMELLTETPHTGTSRKQNRESISGVKWVTLNSAVDMTLYLEGQGGLMGSKPARPAPTTVVARKAAPPETKLQVGPVKTAAPVGAKAPPGVASTKSRLQITTPGRFRYELMKDHDVATFEVQPAGPVVASTFNRPRHVQAIRTNPDGRQDVLVCHYLNLNLRRKEGADGKEADSARATGAKPAGKAPADDQLDGAEIESLRAVSDLSRPSSQVVLVANSEGSLSARGQDFFHDAKKGITVLKGAPVEVDREDGSKINAREIHIQNVTPPVVPGKPEAKPYQNIYATGPGDILMVDRKDNKQATTKAFWQTLLTLTREGEQDLLTLKGAARFIDEQADQSLRADLLKVWLDPPDGQKATAVDSSATGGRKPRHLEATGNVVARSRDMNIHDTGRLVVRFKDEPPQPTLPKPVSPAGRPGAAPGVTAGLPGGSTDPRRPQPQGKPVDLGGARRLPATGADRASPGVASASPPGRAPAATGAPSVGPVLAAPETRPPARPFDLSARSIDAVVIRGAAKSSIDQLLCDGNVIVRQDPASAAEKGTEVKGDTLRMTAGGDGGYYLHVTADQENVAELMTDKIYIIGPEIHIDQTTNKAWVIGGGAMKMDSKTNFQGDELKNPVPLTIHWDKSMLFNGESAEFQGNITGEQDKARLACQHLQVNFDKPISLKEGNKTAEPARVRQMLCDGTVRIEESTFTGTKLTKYTRLVGPVVHMTALEPDDDTPVPAAKPGTKTNTGNTVVVSGMGNIRIWEPSSGEELPGLTTPLPGSAPAKPAAKKPQPAKGPPEMKMTFVTFKNRMDANSKTNKASFWGGVRVLNFPCPHHDTIVNLDTILATDLVEGALYISCDRLHVLDRPTDGKPNKQMEGHGQVYVQGHDFYARSQSITYNQLKEQIILEGTASTPAEMNKVEDRGKPAQKVEGRRIIYNRKRGEIKVLDASSINAEAPRGK